MTQGYGFANELGWIMEVAFTTLNMIVSVMYCSELHVPLFIINLLFKPSKDVIVLQCPNNQFNHG